MSGPTTDVSVTPSDITYILIEHYTESMAAPNLCPNESDATLHVDDYLTNPENHVLAGFMSEGIVGLVKVISDALARVEPDSKTIILNRDTLSDENILFVRDLKAYIDREQMDGKRLNVIVEGDIPVMGWQYALDTLRGKNAQLHCVSLSCKFVPMSSKVF